MAATLQQVRRRRRHWPNIATLGLIALLLSACAGVADNQRNMLDTRGPFAASIAELWWVMFGLGTAVFILVTALVLVIVFRRHSRGGDERLTPVSPSRDNRWIMWGGIVLPVVILAIVFAFTMRSMAAMTSETGSLTIDVIGRRWWWEVQYRDYGITTANQIHIPAGEPVEIRLRSGDVIHSFWVPQLHGKMDAIPGAVTSLPLQADEPGIYRGECAEFCGIQHTHMAFAVVAQPREEFDAWLASEQQPAAIPDAPEARRGLEVFGEAGCAHCHTIRGTDFQHVDASLIDLGPDLTHFASRLTIGAGILPNTRGNLSGWISNPQHIKPGVLMPAIAMSGDDLQALLAYLDTLR